MTIIQSETKKKIGILTFHRSINYGAFMQCYALSNKIQSEFSTEAVEVEVVDFEMLKRRIYYYSIPFRYMIRNKSFTKAYKYIAQYQAFRKELKKLKLSPKFFLSNKKEALYSYIEKRYDVIIVGSDAVWAYHSLGLKNPFWLGPDLNCIKMSYAASAYSLDYEKVPDSHKRYINSCLEKFHYIGVRDDDTFNFIKSINNDLIVQKNCDPTMMLDLDYNDSWKEIFNRYGIDNHKPIICLMLKRGQEIGERLKLKYGSKFQIVSLLNPNPGADFFISDISPTEWSQIFRKFEIVVTDFFHGTVLSIKNLTPIVSIDMSGKALKYKGKMKQVLYDLNLEGNYFVNSLLSENDEMNRLMNKIDYLLNNKADFSAVVKREIEVEKLKYNSFIESLKKVIFKQETI